MINYDRDNLKRRLSELTGEDYTSVPNNKFDEVFPPLMERLKHVKSNSKQIIQGDYTYNIASNVQFKDVAYHMLILPYLENKR